VERWTPALDVGVASHSTEGHVGQEVLLQPSLENMSCHSQILLVIHACSGSLRKASLSLLPT
jgi:hypothetical protein